MKHLLNLYLRAFLKPGSTFRLLVSDSRRLRIAVFAVALTAAVYTLVYVFLILGGGQPFKPWLNIPLHKYYQYNVLFCAPSMFAGWVLASGVIHLCSRLTTRKGSFEQIAAAFGFSLSIASWATGAHDLITSFLGAIHVIDQHEFELLLNSPTIWRTLLWILMAIYVVAFVALFSVSVKVVYQLKTRWSLLLALLGFVVYQLFFLVFNR